MKKLITTIMFASCFIQAMEEEIRVNEPVSKIIQKHPFYAAVMTENLILLEQLIATATSDQLSYALALAAKEGKLRAMEKLLAAQAPTYEAIITLDGIIARHSDVRNLDMVNAFLKTVNTADTSQEFQRLILLREQIIRRGNNVIRIIRLPENVSIIEEITPQQFHEILHNDIYPRNVHPTYFNSIDVERDADRLPHFVLMGMIDDVRRLLKNKVNPNPMIDNQGHTLFDVLKRFSMEQIRARQEIIKLLINAFQQRGIIDFGLEGLLIRAQRQSQRTTNIQLS